MCFRPEDAISMYGENLCKSDVKERIKDAVCKSGFIDHLSGGIYSNMEASIQACSDNITLSKTQHFLWILFTADIVCYEFQTFVL